jgi:hypothetical protein
MLYPVRQQRLMGAALRWGGAVARAFPRGGAPGAATAARVARPILSPVARVSNDPQSAPAIRTRRSARPPGRRDCSRFTAGQRRGFQRWHLSGLGRSALPKPRRRTMEVSRNLSRAPTASLRGSATPPLDRTRPTGGQLQHYGWYRRPRNESSLVMSYVGHMRSTASWLQLASEVLSLAFAILNVVALTRDVPPQRSGLTWRQRSAARYRRHPRMVTVQLAVGAVTLVARVSYFVTQYA